MKDKRQSKRQRREEIMARANRERQTQAVGPQLTGPQGVGAPRVTGSDVPATASPQQRSKPGRLPE